MIRNLRSRALAIVLLLVLCLGLLPATVFAVEDYKITVSGIQVTSENAEMMCWETGQFPMTMKPRR